MFNEIFGKLFYEISGIEGVKIAYAPSWKDVNDGASFRSPNPQEVLSYLQAHQDYDKNMETSMSGPHRDKIGFLHEGRNFIQSASTGQCRLVSLILRVAQSVYYTRATGQKPVLLMDDVLLELDPEKRRKLTTMLPEYEQLFCTFLPGEPYENYRRETTRVYKLNGGGWSDV